MSAWVNPRKYPETYSTNLRLSKRAKVWLMRKAKNEQRTMADIVSELCEREAHREKEE